MKRIFFRNLALALTMVWTASACADFDDYDDGVFDFPETAAPPVPNPIPYEPDPISEAAVSDEAAAPSDEEKKAAEASKKNSSDDGKKSPSAAKVVAKKGGKSEAKAKISNDDGGVKAIKLKGDGKPSDTSSGLTSADSGTTSPSQSPHPVASDELDGRSEGPGRVSPEVLPPKKNVGIRRKNELNRKKKELFEKSDDGNFKEPPRGFRNQNSRFHNFGVDEERNKIPRRGRGLRRAKNGE